MSADISTVVDVTITRETTSVSQAGFGTMLILGDNGDPSNLVREYSSLTEVAENYETTDEEYLAAAAAFSQSPSPDTVKIGHSGTYVAQVQTITFSGDLVASNSVACTIDGVALSATVFATDHLTTMNALATKIAATAGVATATVGGSGNRVITCTAAVAGVPFTITGVVVTLGASQATAAIATSTANVGVQDALSDIIEEDNDWYALMMTDRTEGHVLLAAAYIETLRKIFITCSSDVDILDSTSTTDIAAYFESQNYDRTAVIFNEAPADYPDAAWLGRCLPEDPGEITWKFKTLSGVTASDLSTTDRSDALDKNCNLMTTIGGVDITEEGTMASGEFIDVIRDTDYLQARLEEAVYSRLANLNKIPYTDAGVAIIESEIRAVLNGAVEDGILSSDPAPEVEVPKVADVSEVDRAARFLPDITFTATLAGAIHRVEINGTVSV